MKTLILIASLTLSTQAMARSFVCKSDFGSFGKEHRIILNDREDKAMILTRKSEKLEVNFESSKVISHRWGFNINATERMTVDWNAPENQNRCFVWGKPNMNFVLNTETIVPDDIDAFQGTLYVSPNFIVRPNALCDFPSIALPAPVSLKCKLY